MPSTSIITPDPGGGDRYVPEYEERIHWIWDAPKLWPSWSREVEYFARESTKTQAKRETNPIRRQLRFLSAERGCQDGWAEPPGIVAKHVHRLVETGVVSEQRDDFWRILDEVTARGRALLATDVSRYIRAVTRRCTDDVTPDEWERFKQKTDGAKLLTAIHPATPLTAAHGIGSNDGRESNGGRVGRPPDYSRQEVLHVVELRTQPSTHGKAEQQDRALRGLPFWSMGKDTIAKLTRLNRSKVGRILERTVCIDGSEKRLSEIDDVETNARVEEILLTNPPKWFLELPCV